MKKKSRTDILVEEFLEQAKALQADVGPVRVLKARVYRISEANVLVRSASEGNRRYFFGINYITIEEIANLENPFIAFICGSLERTVIVPAQIFFSRLSDISHDRNGEYKINIDNDLNLVLKGRGNRFDFSPFVNAWNLLLQPIDFTEPRNTAEESIHSVLQGRLIEIGNIRGFRTFCPNKSKKFNNRHLSEISTLQKCPELQFADYEVLRQIDVLWFKEKGKHFIPENAFEVELTTGTWSGVGRLASLIDYANVNLHIVSSNKKRYEQVMHSYMEFEKRYNYVSIDQLGDLYSAELHLRELRYRIGI
jgi:hypothetical protein